MTDLDLNIDAELATAQTVLTDPAQKARLALVHRTLLVAGLDNFKAAVEAAPDDVYVVGIQSPAEWRKSGRTGGPHPDLDVVATGTTITIALGATEHDADAHDQAKAIAAHLQVLGDGPIAYLKTGTFSLAQLLAVRTDDGLQYLDNLLNKAAKTLGARPAAVKVKPAPAITIAPTVDFDLCLTYTGAGDSKFVMGEFAARRLRTHMISDDLRDPRGIEAVYVHDLEIAVMADGAPRYYEVPNVRDEDLATPRRWLNRIPRGTSIVVATDAVACKAIDAAVRNHRADEIVESPIFKRSGWKEIDGEWGFLSPTGFLTADGLTNRGSSKLTKAYDGVIGLVDPDDYEPEAEVAAAENTLAMVSELANLNLFMGMWGPALWNASGNGVGCVPFVVGKKGSGKTTAASGLTAHLAGEFAPSGRSMSTVDGSVSNIGKTGASLHQLFVTVDDSRKRPGRNASEDEQEAIERLIRVGYAGGFAAYSVNEKTSDGTWEQGTPELSDRTIILIGEYFPDAAEGDSSRERIWPISIPSGLNIFKSGNSKLFEELGDSGLPKLHLAYYIRWVARQIENLGGMESWLASCQATHDGLLEMLSELTVSRRIREVATKVLAGSMLWMRYLNEIGVVRPEQVQKFLYDLLKEVRVIAQHHGTTRVKSNDVPLWEPFLDECRAAVAAKTAWVEVLQPVTITKPGELEDGGIVIQHDDDNGRRQLLGHQRNARDGSTYLAMQPRDIQAILSRNSKYRTITTDEIIAGFATIALTDGTRSTKKVRMNGVLTACVCIPWLVFSPEFAPEGGE